MVALTEQKNPALLRFLNFFSEKSFLLGKHGMWNSGITQFLSSSFSQVALCRLQLLSPDTRWIPFSFPFLVQYFFPLPFLPYTAEQPNLVTLIPSRL